MVLGIGAIILFNVVDTIFVGRLGADALAAMSFTFPVTSIVMSLAQGLGMDVGELFDADAEGFTQGTISVTRRGEEPLHRSKTYDYGMLAADVAGKHMVPMIGQIKAHSFAEFESHMSHPGEEFIYVLDGEITVHLKGRPAVTLGEGDCIYFDSGVGHAYVSTSTQDARILGVCWKPG